MPIKKTNFSQTMNDIAQTINYIAVNKKVESGIYKKIQINCFLNNIRVIVSFKYWRRR